MQAASRSHHAERENEEAKRSVLSAYPGFPMRHPRWDKLYTKSLPLVNFLLNLRIWPISSKGSRKGALSMSYGVLERFFSARHLDECDPRTGAIDPETAEAMDRTFEYALDALPCNAMLCDRDLILRYLNRSSRATLAKLEKYLHVPVDQM